MRYAVYEERQAFGLWVYAVAALALGGGGLAMVLGNPGAESALLAGGILLPITLVVLNLLSLRFRVEEDRLCLSLGWLFPVLWRRIPLRDISGVREVTYRPIRDAGGWGLRYGRFEKRFCQFWNARGNRGVLIETPKGLAILGSQRPADLAEAIRQTRDNQR